MALLVASTIVSLATNHGACPLALVPLRTLVARKGREEAERLSSRAPWRSMPCRQERERERARAREGERASSVSCRERGIRLSGRRTGACATLCSRCWALGANITVGCRCGAFRVARCDGHTAVAERNRRDGGCQHATLLEHHGRQVQQRPSVFLVQPGLLHRLPDVRQRVGPPPNGPVRPGQKANSHRRQVLDRQPRRDPFQRHRHLQAQRTLRGCRPGCRLEGPMASALACGAPGRQELNWLTRSPVALPRHPTPNPTLPPSLPCLPAPRPFPHLCFAAWA